jgi:hypothetical protein
MLQTYYKPAGVNTGLEALAAISCKLSSMGRVRPTYHLRFSLRVKKSVSQGQEMTGA